MPPRLGWRVQVANETTPSGQVKTYEYSGTAWVELVGGMSDAPSDGSNYARNNGTWGSWEPLPEQTSTACRSSI